MLQISLQPIPSQVIRVVLGGQNCQLFVYQKNQGLFVDVAVNNTNIDCASLAYDMTPLVSRNYEGFDGNLFFVDTLGNLNPDYTGLGTRYLLLYATEGELLELILP